MDHVRIEQAKRLLRQCINEISALSPETKVKEVKEAMRQSLEGLEPPQDPLHQGESLRAYDGQMLDITGSKQVSIAVREDGKVIWINNEYQCVLRICRIEGGITLEDPKSRVEYVRLR